MVLFIAAFVVGAAVTAIVHIYCCNLTSWKRRVVTETQLVQTKSYIQAFNANHMIYEDTGETGKTNGKKGGKIRTRLKEKNDRQPMLKSLVPKLKSLL